MKNLLLLVLLSGIFACYGQDAPSRLDTMYREMRTMIRNGDPAADSMGKVVLAAARAEKNSNIEAKALLNLGVGATQRRDFKEADTRYNEAYEVYKYNRDTFSMVTVILNRGRNFRKQDSLEKAYLLYTEALEIAENSLPEKHTLRGQIYNLIGITYLDQDLSEEAIQHFDKSIEFYLKANTKRDSMYMLNPMGNKGIILQDLGRYEESIDVFYQVENAAKDSLNKSRTWTYLAVALQETGDLDNALRYNELALRFEKKTGNRMGRLGKILARKGLILGTMGRRNEAERIFEEAMELVQGDSTAQISDKLFTASLYLDFLKQVEAYSKMVPVYETLIALTEKSAALDMDGQLAEARTRYETARKDKKIALLNLEQAKDEKIKKLYLLGAALLALFLLAMLYAYLRTRKQTKVLSSQNQEIQSLLKEKEALIEDLGDTQEQLVQAEKMASLGQLTAGIAHELNNPVAFINGNATALALDFEDLRPKLEAAGEQETLKEVTEAIAGVQRGSERIQNIVSSLRTFSHSGTGNMVNENVHDLLDATLTIIASKLKDISLEREYGEVPHIRCQPSRLSQVFLNLIDNAIDAMPQGGTLSLHTQLVSDRVMITIADTGMGMSDESRKRIFDPFFTTKEVGKGTGLGMSISYGIIKDHGGDIQVHSREGEGTEIVMYLPIENQ